MKKANAIIIGYCVLIYFIPGIFVFIHPVASTLSVAESVYKWLIVLNFIALIIIGVMMLVASRRCKTLGIDQQSMTVYQGKYRFWKHVMLIFLIPTLLTLLAFSILWVAPTPATKVIT